MTPKVVVERLRRLQDALHIIQLNASELPDCAAATAIKVIAKSTWNDVYNLRTDFEQDEDKTTQEVQP